MQSDLRPRCVVLVLVALMLSLCFVALRDGTAQGFPLGSFKDFSLPEYYRPPHETQIKTLLQGAEAVQQPGGGVLIKQLKIQTFREDGAGEFIMHADDCLYDPRLHSASSTGTLEMETADGQFSTVGEGFLWNEDESLLTLSNRVHTVIHFDGQEATQP